jgi:hypothetical protein
MRSGSKSGQSPAALPKAVLAAGCDKKLVTEVGGDTRRWLCKPGEREDDLQSQSSQGRVQGEGAPLR